MKCCIHLLKGKADKIKKRIASPKSWKKKIRLGLENTDGLNSVFKESVES